MGILFTKKKSISRVNEQDKAILQLKQTRDRLRQYQKQIDQNILKDKELAVKFLQKNQRSRALVLLRKKKLQEELLLKTDNELMNLEQMVDSLEFAEVQTKVMDGLKQGNDALRILHELLSIEDIEDLLGETKESIEKQQHINSLLSGVLTEEDENTVETELKNLMIEESEDANLQGISYRLPDVPIAEPRNLMDKSMFQTFINCSVEQISKHSLFAASSPTFKEAKLSTAPI